ncbi:MAG: hypothetical protein NVSMB10_10680 [Steroidobacteraceae bacterium]
MSAGHLTQGRQRNRRRAFGHTLWALTVILTGSYACADDAASGRNANSDFLGNWFATSDAAKEEQPHWMTPVVTVTPRLEQEYRYDQSWQSRPKNVDVDNYGGGKGLELIPTENTELILGVPGYQTRTTPKKKESGWADETFLLKYRGAAGNEEHGNYIVTGFLGVSVPTGADAFTNHDTIITPTLAVGKGWGTRASGFDIQSTLGIAIPTGDKRTLGTPINWNTAFQAHVLEKLWPEIEANVTRYRDGPSNGKTQVALTAGLVLGRFEITPRVKFIIGGGYQKPVSSFYTYNHTWVMTARAAF